MFRNIALSGLAFAALAAPAAAQEGALTDDEALMQDARIYARMYGVDAAEAARRIKLMVSAQGEVAAQEAAEGEALVAGYFSHGPTFKYVIETQATGKAPKALQVGIQGRPDEKASLPVEYRRSARASRSSIRKIFREKNNVIERLFPNAEIVSYDEKDGALTLSFKPDAVIAEEASRVKQLENVLKVGVRIKRLAQADTQTGMRGGLQPWRNSGTATSPVWITNCTLGFAAQSSDGKQGYITAGHCADNIAWKEPGTNTYQPLTTRDFQTAKGDWQFSFGAPVDRLFKADNSGSFRSVTGRRTLSTTCEKTGQSILHPNDIVVTGGVDDSSCDGAVNGTFVCWYPGHYGAPVAANHGQHSVSHPGAGQQCGEVNAKYVKVATWCGAAKNIQCDYAWVEVLPKEGENSFVAAAGDSGSPIFTWNTAFGIITNSNWYDETTGRSSAIWYTPLDEIYRNGYSLLY
jgi:hypothetical protein